MIGLKKLALTTAVLAASTGAFAMEALQDDALSNTTGQAGLTILMSNVNVGAAAVRYSDSDGTTGAAAALGIGATPVPAGVGGPCAGSDTLTCANSFSSRGTLNLAGFSISATSILTTVDVGSTGVTATDTTGLLIGSTINNLNVNLGGISFDNGNQLGGATNAPVYTAGYLTGGNDIGGIALTGISLPSASAILISAGTKDFGNSGVTITSLIPIATLGLTVNYYNTTMEKYTPGVGFTANAGNVANDGLVSLPITLSGVLMGPTEIAAGKAGGGYATNNTQGLEIGLGGMGIASVDIGGAGGIQIAGTNAGSIGILGLQVGATQLNVSGH